MPEITQSEDELAAEYEKLNAFCHAVGWHYIEYGDLFDADILFTP